MSLKPLMDHATLQQACVDLLRMNGYNHLHVRKSIGTRSGGRRGYMTTTNLKGWPDILGFSTRQPGRHVAVEVKVSDYLSQEQREVLAELAASGFECWVLTEDYLERFGNALRRPRPDGVSALSSGDSTMKGPAA